MMHKESIYMYLTPKYSRAAVKASWKIFKWVGTWNSLHELLYIRGGGLYHHRVRPAMTECCLWTLRRNGSSIDQFDTLLVSSSEIY